MTIFENQDMDVQQWSGSSHGGPDSRLIARLTASLTYLVAALLLAVPALAAGPDEAGLRAADEAQRQAALSRDADALLAMTLSGFMVNGPEGDIVTRERMVGRFRNREVGHDSFSRTVEKISITGNVGIVMGSESVTPSPDSLAGQRRANGGKPVYRRFTNVWLWQDNSWKWLMRHANERPDTSSGREGPK